MTPEAGPDITVLTAALGDDRAATVPPLPCITSRSRAEAARRQLAAAAAAM